MPVRTRSSRRPAWYEQAAAAASAAAAAATGARADSPRRRQRSRRTESPYTTYNSHPSTYPSSSPPPSSSRSSSDADALLRTCAMVVGTIALGLVFLNVALQVALVTAAVLVPAWRTFKAVEAAPTAPPAVIEILDDDDDDDEGITEGYVNANDFTELHCPESGYTARWQKFWVTAGVLFGVHAIFLRSIVGVIFPSALYRILALALFTWLNGNDAGNAATVYDGMLRPALLKSERAVDAAATSVLEYGDDCMRHAILAVNQAVKPYARQLEHAAATTRARMEEQTRTREESPF